MRASHWISEPSGVASVDMLSPLQKNIKVKNLTENPKKNSNKTESFLSLALSLSLNGLVQPFAHSSQPSHDAQGPDVSSSADFPQRSGRRPGVGRG